MACKLLVCFFMLLSLSACVVESQPVITFTAKTPSESYHGKVNTILGTAAQIASGLLNSSTHVLLWGTVPSSSITELCDVIVQTGTHTVIANVHHSNWRFPPSPFTISLKLIATGGCKALPDSAETQFLFEITNLDPRRRRIAIICPRSNARKFGCGVYVTGCDVERLYNDQKLKLFGQTGSSVNEGCYSGVYFTGERTEDLKCSNLDPAFAPFCRPGEEGAAVFSACSCTGTNCCTGPACFPGNAKVELPNGSLKQMNELMVGDKIAVEMNGHKEFQDIYAFGHKDKKAFSEFVKIYMSKNNKTLELSHGHFVPVLMPSGVLYKRAKDVKLGDTLMVAESSNTLMPCEVTEVSTIFSEGLFNPLTLAGTIVVNGVVASAHSDWFLDNMFDALGITHLLPAAYQFVLLPARFLYRVLGMEIYVAGYNWIDSKLDIAETGTKFGGTISAAAVLLVVAGRIKFGSKVYI